MSGVYEYDGVRFRYEIHGEGFPFVFNHGLGGDRTQPRDLAGVVPGYGTIVWDNRAHGETRPVGPPEALGFERTAEDLGALLDHLEISEAVVGGISMGAGVTARFAIRNPGRVRALVLCRPAWLDRPLPESLALFPVVADLLGRDSPESGEAELRARPEFKKIEEVSKEMAESLLQQFHKPEARERRERLERFANSAPISDWDDVAGLSVPALVVGNDRDPVHPWEFAEEWAARLSNARLVKIPSKAESEERHAAEFRAALVDFLDAVGRGDFKPC